MRTGMMLKRPLARPSAFWQDSAPVMVQKELEQIKKDRSEVRFDQARLADSD
jgi:hypothetical protein